MSVPNQLVIQEFNYEPCDKSNFYATINLEAMKYAIQTFSAINSLRLWMYLSKNNKGFKHLELSSKDCISWGLGKTQFSKAKDDLIAKGFLCRQIGLRQLFCTGGRRYNHRRPLLCEQHIRFAVYRYNQL